jgi:uncharacterized protein
LSQHRVDFNILTVITPRLAANISKVYSFYKRNRFFYQQYIPCLDPIGEAPERHALPAAVYGDFLKRLFDLWYIDIQKGLSVSIRYFDNLVMMLRGYPPESCGMAGRCVIQHVVEADGGVYPCDFYVLDAYKIGNLNTDSFSDIAARARQSGFVDASRPVSPECKKCRWHPLCRGGCRRDWEPFVDGAPSQNNYCEAYKSFFAYAIDRLDKLAGNKSHG